MVVKILLALVALLVVAAGWLAYRSMTAPVPDAKLVDGRLRPCPGTPNCVCSEDGDPAAQIAPLAFEGAPERAWRRLTESIRALGGTIVADRDGYLRATFTSRVFRFVDDVELRMVADRGLIHVRSASRVGKSDFGVNRKRVEALRARFPASSGALR
jgi:uncharacterized protein (DUF1499 family)